MSEESTFEPVSGAVERVLADVEKKRQAATGIERIPIKNREQWLSLRRKDVTASAISCLLGEHDFLTPYELWALKSGLLEEESDEPKIDETSITLSPMSRGLLYEDKAAELARRLRPGWKVWRADAYFRDPAARIGATPDFFAEDENRALGILQIKTSNPFKVRDDWKQPGGSFIPPLGYAIQTVVEASLTGASWAAIGLLVNEAHTTTFRLVDVPLEHSAAIMSRLRAEVSEFWRRVEEKDSPPADYRRDGEAIRAAYKPTGEIVDLTGDNRVLEIAAEYARAAAEEKDAGKRKDALKAEFIEKMRGAEVATIDGREIATLKEVVVKAHQRKESRSLRLTFKGEAA